MTCTTNVSTNPTDTATLLSQDEQAYRVEYTAVLDICARVGGATLSEIKESFSNLTTPDGSAVLPQRFIDALKKRGALVWTAEKTWLASDFGKVLLGELRNVEGAAQDARLDGDMVAAQMRVRADIYGLLARIFRVEADQELIDRLKATGNVDPKEGLMAQGLNALARYAREARGDVIKDLAVDYVKAFIGTGIDGHEAAYPFESAYTSEKHLLMQASRDEVLAIYLSEDLGRATSWKVGEDHVALELEFMQTLAGRTADAFAAGDETEAARLLDVQKNFLHDHLAAWAPAFAGDIRIFAKTDFYQGLTNMFEGFIATDVEYLK